jgi:hypothetical protein
MANKTLTQEQKEKINKYVDIMNAKASVEIAADALGQTHPETISRKEFLKSLFKK